jgi:hypothetical protein
MLEEFLHTLESTKDGCIRAIVFSEKITINQMLIVQQFGVSFEGVVDTTNAFVKEAQVTLKNIVGLDAFVNKKQWSVIRMKEEYQAKFVAILQIIYHQERLAYFTNRIAITFNLANKRKKINSCSIMLTWMSIELTQWTKH